MNEIKSLVLLNGDKLIFKLIKIYDDRYIVEKPIILKEVLTANGLSIIPVPIQSNDIEYIIFKNGIIIDCFNPPEEIIELFNKMTSNILVPTKNKIIS